MLVLIASSAMFLVSCNDDDDFVQGDLTALNALIADAEAMSAAATPTDYPQSAIDDFNATLASVKTAAAEPLTQTEIDNLYTQLDQAMILFDSQAYGYIDESLYLNAGWHFDEGTGTSAADYSGNSKTGTLTNGPTWVAGKVPG